MGSKNFAIIQSTTKRYANFQDLYIRVVEKENGVYKHKEMIKRLTSVTEGIAVDEITKIYEYKNCRNKLVHRKMWRPSSKNVHKKNLTIECLDLTKNNYAGIKMDEMQLKNVLIVYIIIKGIHINFNLFLYFNKGFIYICIIITRVE